MYTNSQYGFSIKYPHDTQTNIITTVRSSEDICDGKALQSIEMGIYPKDYVKKYAETHFGGNLLISILVYENSKELPYEQWIKQDCPNFSVILGRATPKIVLIDNSRGIKIYPAGGMSLQNDYIISHKKSIFIINGFGYNEQYVETLFDKILSTFRFD